MKTLRLILGDQLHYGHSWFKEVDPNITYFLAEMRQETDYVVHHIQKVVAFFEAMECFAKWLESQGHRVVYYQLDHPDNLQDLEANLTRLISRDGFWRFEYQLPDEYRLDQQLINFCEKLEIETRAVDSEHFLSSRTELATFFAGKKEMVMEYFYRHMRRRYGVLMHNQKDPVGGKWNFDQSNRKKWKGDPPIPPEKTFARKVEKTVGRIREAGVTTMGHVDAHKFAWPVSREEALEVLDYFCRELLVHFGDFQDALHTEQKFLFHSRLSFALNSKILHPKEVIDAAVASWERQKERIHISQVEGFVRQILGWREYMRGIYWKEMPGYERLNKLDNHNPLPDFFWSGQTKMNCLRHAIGQSLENAYAHHIQRLMITGNFALLAECDPEEVDRWYLGIYIDALQWVELPNTRGMSQFADGGIVATKPYISSANYINKMGNYCQGCKYDHKAKTGEDACPFNSLYWNFLDEKKAYFEDNRRMGMMLNLLKKKPASELAAIKERAAQILADPSKF